MINIIINHQGLYFIAEKRFPSKISLARVHNVIKHVNNYEQIQVSLVIKHDYMEKICELQSSEIILLHGGNN